MELLNMSGINDSYKSIGLFIDGGYYAKINEALESQSGLNIRIGALMQLVRQQVAGICGTDVS